MQQVVSPPRPPIYPNRNGHGGRSPSTRPQSIIIAAITLFALSGLLIGFSVGALNRPKATQATVPNNSKGTTPVATRQASPTVASAITPSQLGCPYVGSYTVNETSGRTYKLTSYARDESSKNTCSVANKPIHVAGITFKLWLIQRLPDHKGITFSTMTPKQLFNTISTSITGKTLDLNTGKPTDPDLPDLQLLSFDSTTSQVQLSDKSGQVAWTYTIASSTPDGDYDLIILSDWNGQYYNWSWANIEIKKGN